MVEDVGDGDGGVRVMKVADGIHFELITRLDSETYTISYNEAGARAIRFPLAHFFLKLPTTNYNSTA